MLTAAAAVINSFTHTHTHTHTHTVAKAGQEAVSTDRVCGEDVGVSEESAAHADGARVLVEREVGDAWLKALQAVQDGSLREISTTRLQTSPEHPPAALATTTRGVCNAIIPYLFSFSPKRRCTLLQILL